MPHKKPFANTPGLAAYLEKYLAEHPEIDDVIFSGGDTLLLRPEFLWELGQRALSAHKVMKVRIATKGLAVSPQSFVSENAWFRTLLQLNELAKRDKKSFMIHTHFCHPSEVTKEVERAAILCGKHHLRLRNQGVLLRNINDDPKVLAELIQKLSYLGIQTYYVHLHDFVRQNDFLRTSLHKAQCTESELRGKLSGMDMPQFVIDLPGGGGKRSIHDSAYYDRNLGVSLWRGVSDLRKIPTEMFFYGDPLRELTHSAQKLWKTPHWPKKILQMVREKYLASSKSAF